MDSVNRRMGGLTDQVLDPMAPSAQLTSQGQNVLLDPIKHIQGVIEDEPNAERH